MIPILPNQLWIGHAGDSHDPQRLYDLGIKALVQLAREEPTLHLPRDLIYARFPLVDGADNEASVITLAIRTVASLLALQVPTLVSCGEGLSRSPCIAAAAMALALGGTPEDALRCIAQHHRGDICPVLWNDVLRLRARWSEALPEA
jgi:hypothetical protein